MSAASEREKTAAAVELLGALPMPVGPGPLPLSAEREALIRRSRTHCDAAPFESEDDRPLHVWGPSSQPTLEMCQLCTVRRDWAEDPDTDEGLLLAEVDRLRARVAELDAERKQWRQTAHRLAGQVGLVSREASSVDVSADKLTRLLAPTQTLREDEPVMPGACKACGAAPEKWCPDCGACKAGCYGGHDDNPCSHSNAPWGGAE